MKFNNRNAMWKYLNASHNQMFARHYPAIVNSENSKE